MIHGLIDWQQLSVAVELECGVDDEQRAFWRSSNTRCALRRSSDQEGTLVERDSNDFIVVTRSETARTICREIRSHFNKEVQVFYPYKIRSEGKVVYTDGLGNKKEAPFMSLSIASLQGTEGPFTDIRQITEVAAEIRRQRSGCPE